MEYCIVDVETTGNGTRKNEITEIAIFKTNGKEITASYHSLVNPKCKIPRHITGLTGIDDSMVAFSPTFEEIAEDIYRFTDGCVFVAHSVNFDFGILKNSFERNNITFNRKKLCTVRMARKVFPGLASYSLGKLCHSLEIPLNNRHRAAGDAEATCLLFHKIYSSNRGKEVIENGLSPRSREVSLPPLLDKAILQKIPETPGVYYFWSARRELLYVGKAINLIKRVWGHFYDKSDKETTLCRLVADITFEETGSELMALVVESLEIKKKWPPHNRAQKRKKTTYGIFIYQDGYGLKRIGYGPVKSTSMVVRSFYNPQDCRAFLSELVHRFELCPKHVQLRKISCAHEEACMACEKQIESYNKKVNQLETFLLDKKGYQLILLAGRAKHENGVIVMKNFQYYGRAFIPRQISVSSWIDLEPFIERGPSNKEIDSILSTYIANNHQSLVKLEEEEEF